MLSPEYVAGFFDGEGCVCISLRRGGAGQAYLRCQITNTNKSILQEIQDDYGGTITKFKPRSKKCKMRYNVTWQGPKAMRFLGRIAEHVVLKKKQVCLALDFCEFMFTPPEDRLHWQNVPTSKQGPGLKGTILAFVRTPETVHKELGFKTRMNRLNKRGVA